MIMAMNQPYFIPYIGYWQLINQADVFVIGDDYNYINRGWIDRNRLLLDKKSPSYFNVEVAGKSQNKLISELTLAMDEASIKKNYGL